MHTEDVWFSQGEIARYFIRLSGLHVNWEYLLCTSSVFLVCRCLVPGRRPCETFVTVLTTAVLIDTYRITANLIQTNGGCIHRHIATALRV
ncbi:hypothetical protein FA95DRAFT_1034530 [Auriscalpium vulgare]|uniref:Uncharacterized protein n=1 Tax=Auriscalpium vulgare TaxID=40419 RepID=A0ACB8RWJ6_9AGAM|nr:hypothetical protein FA95DRAFT_1034530 [Auriscalpium vulgare]